MTRSIEFTVPGEPVPQGSKGVTRGGVLFDTNATKLRPWRRAVAEVARLHRVTWILQSPLEVRLLFVVKPPPRGRHDGEWCATKPDIDKLTRAVLDALTDGHVLVDDAQVVRLIAEKRLGDEPGVRITVSDVAHVYPATEPPEPTYIGND